MCFLVGLFACGFICALMQVCELMVVAVLVLVAVRLRYCCYVVVWVVCFVFGGLVLLFGFVIVFVC